MPSAASYAPSPPFAIEPGCAAIVSGSSAFTVSEADVATWLVPQTR